MSAPAPPRLSALRPKPVVTAIRLMYAGVLLALIGVLVNALSRNAITSALEHTNDSRPLGDRLKIDGSDRRFILYCRAADAPSNGRREI